MKKILKPLFCAAALVLLAGCNKFDEANATPETSNGSLIKVYANVAENDGTRANINVGESVFTQCAGIHADGLLKDAEIYTIFDTEKLLNRPASVQVGKTSGLAGIAYWINQNYRLRSDHQLSKHDALVEKLKVWVDEQYAGGRTTALSNEELEEKIEEL